MGATSDSVYWGDLSGAHAVIAPAGAMACVSDLQRAIFFDVRMEGLTHDQLAERHGITTAQVEAEFAAALRIYLRTLREPEPWWRRLSHVL